MVTQVGIVADATSRMVNGWHTAAELLSMATMTILEPLLNAVM